MIQTPDIYHPDTNFQKEPKDQPQRHFRKSISLIRYLQKPKVQRTKKLLEKSQNSTKSEEPEEVDENHYPHMKNEISLNVVPDHTVYDKVGGMSFDIFNSVKFYDDINAYGPILHLSDFWTLNKNCILLNETISDVNVTLKLQNLWLIWYQFEFNFKWQWGLVEDLGLIDARFQDEMKTIWSETNKVLFVVTIIVSCLHSVFEILAFRNDINFWRQKKSMQGMSLKSL